MSKAFEFCEMLEDIKLEPFNKKVYQSIEGRSHMFIGVKGNKVFSKEPDAFMTTDPISYTVVEDGKEVGIVGFDNGIEQPFLHIGIIKEFRGNGILDRAYKTLAKKHGFHRVYVDIEKSNPESVEAHKKAGFKPCTEKVDRKCYPGDIRMYKDY